MTLSEFLAAAQAWLSLVAVMLSVGGIVYAWMTSKSKANTQRLDALDQRLGTHADRLQTIEAELRHMPDKDTVNELRVSFAQLSGTIGSVSAKLEGIATTVSRIDTYLLEKAK